MLYHKPLSFHPNSRATAHYWAMTYSEPGCVSDGLAWARMQLNVRKWRASMCMGAQMHISPLLVQVKLCIHTPARPLNSPVPLPPHQAIKVGGYCSSLRLWHTVMFYYLSSKGLKARTFFISSTLEIREVRMTL